ncbi:MAG: 30S ribosomal protein S12 methylthiotransferase RimO [Clostridia bacterium]|nr:30S ribosomal protein S12 methylthiotransferase RimO [Clostridia bacterium]
MEKQKVGLISLGCAKNLVDSENLLGQLRELGMEIVSDPADADVIFVNTCGFIESAKEESIDAIFEMARYKKTGHLKRLFAVGCLAQRYPEALLSEIPELDGIMGVFDYVRLRDMLKDAENGLRPCYTQFGPRFTHTPRVLTSAGYTAYVKIADGCDNRCTFCAIPLIRGGYVSRPFEDILEECRRLAEGGVTEITLIAQDTSRYGCDIGDGRYLLPDLLRAVSAIDGVRWVRVLYCYPDSSDDALLDAIAELPKVAPYLDLPLQHIDDTILRRMHRRGDAALIRDRIDACRKRGILVRTTMITGFPGETEEQFERLLRFVQETRFERLGAFAYSAEEGTPAERMPDQVDEAVRQERLDRLMMLQQGISMEINEARIGETCEVLVDGCEDGRWYGRSILEAPESDGCIWLEGGGELCPGMYVKCRIESADAYDLYAVIIP